MNARNTHSRLRRRNFLKGLGLSAAAAPFLPILDSHAGTQAPPKRFIAVYTSNGMVAENWDPGPDFTMGPILAPLQDHASRLVLINGLRMQCSLEAQGAGGHAAGTNGCLTGSLPELIGPDTDVSLATSISIDQYFAEQLGTDTKFGSLQAGVGVSAPEEAGNAVAYAGYKAPILPENNPQVMFDRVFSDFDSGGGLTPEQLQLIADERSLIDVVKGDLAALQGRVSSEDLHKVDAHLEAIRELESSLGQGAGDWQNEACALPQAPVSPPNADHMRDDNAPLMAQQQIDLLTMSLACDLTRFATLQLSGAGSEKRFPWLGLDRSHHDYAHEQTLPGNPSAQASARASLTAINTWHAEQVRYLLDRLDSYPEGNGSMLDNTVVLWVNELATGNHDRNDFRILMTDGGYFDGGRLIQLDNQAQRAETDYNDMLVSVCHAVGLADVETFGDAAFSSGNALVELS